MPIIIDIEKDYLYNLGLEKGKEINKAELEEQIKIELEIAFNAQLDELMKKLEATAALLEKEKATAAANAELLEKEKAAANAKLLEKEKAIAAANAALLEKEKEKELALATDKLKFIQTMKELKFSDDKIMKILNLEETVYLSYLKEIEQKQ